MKKMTEKELVKKLAYELKSKFNTDIAVTELSAGYGIVDLVFAKNFFRQTNKFDRVPLNNFLAVKLLLEFSSKKSFTKIEATNTLKVSNGQAMKALNILLENDYIQKVGKTFSINLSVKNPVKKIVAIEAKLKDWKQGLMQARRYKSFTDECYLAILSSVEKNIDYDMVQRFGVGVIVYDESTGQIKFKAKPKVTHLSIYDKIQDQFAKELFLYEAYLKLS